MSAETDVFVWQAQAARSMGSLFTARVLEAIPRQLHRAPRTAKRVAEWPGDPKADALALRLAGALHALARSGAIPRLSELYRARDGDVDSALAEAFAREDAVLVAALDAPPQTNEVGRSAAVWAALMRVSRRFGPRMALLELGSSAGLNLNLDLYAYDLGGVITGAGGSPVRLAPEWRGPAPQPAPVEILDVRGVDIAPLDPRDPVARERLLSFVWPDDLERARRLGRALDLAAEHPPTVDRGDAAEWLEAQLAEEQPEGLTRVIFHSIVLQYLSAEAQARVRAAIVRAGARATPTRPLAWIAFEWNAARGCAVLALTTWPGSEAVELATCHAHAAWIAWRTD